MPTVDRRPSRFAADGAEDRRMELLLALLLLVAVGLFAQAAGVDSRRFDPEGWF